MCISGLLIQRSFSFEFPQTVTPKPCHTVGTKSQEDFPGYSRHGFDDEESEARRKAKELEPLLKNILSKTQATNTDTTDDEEKAIFFLRQNRSFPWIHGWLQKIYNNYQTTTTTPAISTPSTTTTPATPINDELSKVLEKLSSTLERLTYTLGDRESGNELVCVRVGPKFKDATRGRRKKRQAESIAAKNSLKTTTPFRMYYLRKANRTLQSDKRVNVTQKNKHLEEVRDKLYSYIDDKFKNVIKNAAPLQTLRNDLGENSGFKIGYLIANLDVLIENIRKLKADTDSKRDNFEEELFLDTFNKLQSAFKVVANIETTVNKTLSDMKV